MIKPFRSLVLPFETLHLPGDPDLSRLMLYAAEPGSSSEKALRSLAETSTHISSADLAAEARPAHERVI